MEAFVLTGYAQKVLSNCSKIIVDVEQTLLRYMRKGGYL